MTRHQPLTGFSEREREISFLDHFRLYLIFMVQQRLWMAAVSKGALLKIHYDYMMKCEEVGGEE